MITRWNIDELYHSDDELYHHGVLGMRWGHRKAENRTNSNRRRAIAKKVAIGAGVGVGVGVGGYLAQKKGLFSGAKKGVVGIKNVSRPHIAEKLNRYTGRGYNPDRLISTPKIGNVRLSKAKFSSNGNFKRLISSKGNVKVSNLGTRAKTTTRGNRIISDHFYNNSQKASMLKKVNTPVLKGRSGTISKSKIPNSFENTDLHGNPKGIGFFALKNEWGTNRGVVKRPGFIPTAYDLEKGGTRKIWRFK